MPKSSLGGRAVGLPINRFRTWRSHLRLVKQRLSEHLVEKYKAGQREHGDQMWERPSLVTAGDLLDEVVDLAVYGYTLLDHLTTIAKLCDDGLRGEIPPEQALAEIQRLITTGVGANTPCRAMGEHGSSNHAATAHPGNDQRGRSVCP